jgi:hypothetical protein
MDMIRVRDRFPKVIVAEWDALDGVYDPLEVARVAIAGLFQLGAGLFEPLSVEVALACCDAPTGTVIDVLDDEHRRLAVDSGDAGTLLDSDGVLRWLSRQLAFDCPASGAASGWAQLNVEQMRVRLPPGLVGPGEDSIALDYVNGKLRYPVVHLDGHHWAYGPPAGHSDAAPMSVHILQDAGYLSMSLSLGWTLWADEEGAAFRDVQDALARLAGAGWDVLQPPDGSSE